MGGALDALLSSAHLPQTQLDRQSHLLWALTGHVLRQRRELAEQRQWVQRIQER